MLRTRPVPVSSSQRPRGHDAVVVRHQLAELAAVGRHDPGQHGRRQVLRGEHESLGHELADLEGLVHAVPPGDILSRRTRPPWCSGAATGCGPAAPSAGPTGPAARESGSPRPPRPPPRARTVSRGPGAPGRTKCAVTPVTARPARVIRSTRQSANSRAPQRQRARHAGHQHRALRAGRAAAGAAVRARAVQLAAPVRDDRPAPGVGPRLDQLRIPPDRLRVLQADRVPGLGPGEVRLHVAARRCASTPCADQRSSTRAGVRQDIPPLTTVEPPTHRPSANSTDGPSHRHPAAPVTVQGPQRPPASGGEQLGRVVAALLDHDDVHARLGELRRHRRPAGPRPHDHHIAVHAQVPGDVPLQPRGAAPERFHDHGSA